MFNIGMVTMLLLIIGLAWAIGAIFVEGAAMWSLLAWGFAGVGGYLWGYAKGLREE